MAFSKVRFPLSKSFLFNPLCRYLHENISTVSNKYSLTDLYQSLVPTMFGYDGHQHVYKDSKSYGEGKFDLATIKERLVTMLVSWYHIEKTQADRIVNKVIGSLEVDYLYKIIKEVYGSSRRNRKLAIQTLQYFHKNKKLLIHRIKCSGIPNLEKSNFYQAANSSFLTLMPRDIARIVSALFYHGAYDLDNLTEKYEEDISWYYLRHSETNLDNQLYFFMLEAKKYTRANDHIKHYDVGYESYGYLYFKKNYGYRYVLREFQSQKDYIFNLYRFINKLIKLGFKSIEVESSTRLIRYEAIEYLLSKGFISDEKYSSMIILKAN